MKIEYTEKLLREVVKESSTYRQVLQRFGRYNDSSGSYKGLKTKIKEWGISTDHFLSPSEVMKKVMSDGKIKKTPNSEIFVENSKAKRGTAKNRIINDNLMEYKCVMCGNEGEWMGNKITLILDHINGVNNDHRLENLRFLCPNCNSTLDTHCVGHHGLGKEPKVDGRTLRKGIDRPEIRKVDRPTKEELEDLLSKNSYVSLGKRFGVSDNAVRKWAKKYGIL